MPEGDLNSDGAGTTGEGDSPVVNYAGVHREGQTGRHGWNPVRTISDGSRLPLGELANPNNN